MDAGHVRLLDMIEQQTQRQIAEALAQHEMTHAHETGEHHHPEYALAVAEAEEAAATAIAAAEDAEEAAEDAEEAAEDADEDAEEAAEDADDDASESDESSEDEAETEPARPHALHAPLFRND